MKQKPTVFISYSGESQFLKTLRSHLNDFEITISEDNIRAGEFLKPKIMNDIERADVVVLIWTKKSCRSSWVNQEIGYAISKKKMIVPIVDQNLELKGFLADIEPINLIRKDLDKTALIVTNRLSKLLMFSVNSFNSYEKYCDWWMTIDESDYVAENDYAYWLTQHDLWSIIKYDQERIYLKCKYKTIIRGDTAFDKKTVDLANAHRHIYTCGVSELALNHEALVLGNVVVETNWDPEFMEKISSYLEKHNGEIDDLFHSWYGNVSKEETRIITRFNYSPELAVNYKKTCEYYFNKYNAPKMNNKMVTQKKSRRSFSK